MNEDQNGCDKRANYASVQQVRPHPAMLDIAFLRGFTEGKLEPRDRVETLDRHVRALLNSEAMLVQEHTKLREALQRTQEELTKAMILATNRGETIDALRAQRKRKR